MKHTNDSIKTPQPVQKGSPLPFGATPMKDGVNFSLFSKHASAVKLHIYDFDKQSVEEFLFDPLINKTGDVWHLLLTKPLTKAMGYYYTIEGISTPKEPFTPSSFIVDPYAKAIYSHLDWGLCDSYKPIGVILPPSQFDWEGDQPLNIPKNDLIIYEMHVRSFTQDPSSRVKAPGTFQGVIEKIPHLLELGVNAVELLPLQEFNENEYKRCSTRIKQKLFQYWGYSTVNYFSPMNRYAANKQIGAAVDEFKRMVKALHQNGIAVILDVVFNHTSEGDIEGPIQSFKAIENSLYYMTDSNGSYLNFTGCGNTLNTNHPYLIELIIDVLRYWVLEMHVDGFRFDLASIFYRDQDGQVISKPPIIEAISKDPLLAKVLMIAEPWDAVGLYQVGNFYPYETRWSEWNARYRDTVRRFIKGDSHYNGKFASHLSGSQDMYAHQDPSSSINFIVAHDGFTLHDLVSYNHKHNLPNGENNLDGLNENDSWNCGSEGFTDDKNVNELRSRQMRNFHLALMMSQGIPMLVMGDEYAHTKKGNNNTWCHDNPLNWFLWDKLQENESFYRYYRTLIAFRKKQTLLHRNQFLKDKDVTWWNSKGEPIRWDKDTQFLAFTLHDHEKNEDLYCAFNASPHSLELQIPSPKDNKQWHIIVNTSDHAPDDIFDESQAPQLQKNSLTLLPFSSLLLKSM